MGWVNMGVSVVYRRPFGYERVSSVTRTCRQLLLRRGMRSTARGTQAGVIGSLKRQPPNHETDVLDIAKVRCRIPSVFLTLNLQWLEIARKTTIDTASIGLM